MLEVSLAESKKYEELRQQVEKLAYQNMMLKTALENDGAMVALLDSDFNFVMASKAFINACGHAWEELEGKNYFLCSPDPESEAIFRRVRDTGEPASSRHKPLVFGYHADKEHSYWDWTLVPVKDAGGKVTGLVLSQLDMSKHMKLESLKDDFIGMISHEIKTPLSVIIGALSVVTQRGISSFESRELLNDAVVSAELLTGIVENLLELSRSHSERLDLQKQTADIVTIFRSVVDRLRSRSAQHRLVIAVPEDLPKVSLDAMRIELVLYNLVENAIKYSNKGEVKVFARRQDGELLVGVSDQGRGISLGDQKKLFQSFQRAGTAIEKSTQGMGLGLMVCRVLIDAHGGRIWVESKPGKGSTFYFTLPVDGKTEPEDTLK
jgi:PAS domain S-box-containing protein